MPMWQELYVARVEDATRPKQVLGLQPTGIMMGGFAATDAQVAIDFGGLNAVITSPNSHYIPQFPRISGQRIVTRKDGFWGPQEYSKWPQQYHPDVVHHVCIPRCADPSGRGPGYPIWQTLSSTDFETTDSIWPRTYGYLRETVWKGLNVEAERAMDRFMRAGDPSLVERKEHGYHLCNLLRNALQRLERIPGSFLHTVAVTAHVQRLVLKLSGFSTYLEVIRPRLRDPFCSASAVLDVRGGFLNSPTTATEFFRVGVPFWLFQHYTPTICIMHVMAEFVPISSALELEPAFPGLERAMYDPTGVWQDPSKWPAPMLLHSSYLFAAGTLPRMLPSSAEFRATPRASGSGEPAAKHLKTDEPLVEPLNQPKKKGSARRGARGAKKKPHIPHPAFVHALPPLHHPQPPAAWTRALAAVGALPDPPPHAALYYFPPPYLFVPDDPKTMRYLHNWICIRTFCRQRLVDITIDGSPLRLSEWHNALWGDYTVPTDDGREATDNNGYTQAQKAAHERKLELRKLFAGAGSLPSYEPTCAVEWASRTISASDVAADAELRAAVLWELHEVNFRCELRDLDREILGGALDNNMFFQWERGDVIASVWGSSGALSVFPDVESGEVVDNWMAPTPHNWANRRETLEALLVVMSRWPDFPQDLWTWCTILKTGYGSERAKRRQAKRRRHEINN